MVRAGLREPFVDAVLESVVNQGYEAQEAPALVGIVGRVQGREEVAHVGADASFRMPLARSAPRETGEQLRVLTDGALELRLGNEAGDEFGDARQAGSMPCGAHGRGRSAHGRVRPLLTRRALRP